MRGPLRVFWTEEAPARLARFNPCTVLAPMCGRSPQRVGFRGIALAPLVRGVALYTATTKKRFSPHVFEN